jgi:hypothetical protein
MAECDKDVFWAFVLAGRGGINLEERQSNRVQSDLCSNTKLAEDVART